MRKSKEEAIGNLIMRFMRQEGLETPYNQHRLISSWPDVMGKTIAKYTGNIFIKGQTLHVQIRSSVIRQELQINSSEIVARLNNHVKAQVITAIQFH